MIVSTNAINFENFELDPSAFELRRDGETVSLEPQEFSILAYLAGRPGALVSRDELLDEVWGHQHVTDSALSTRIKGIRKALDDDGQQQRLIQTVRGRGFRFAGETSQVTAPAQVVPLEVPPRPSTLPRERTPIFGRDQLRRRCRNVLSTNRLVSLLGIGGSGKTRLAIAVGHDARDDFRDGVWFVDLVPCADSTQIETAIANAVRYCCHGHVDLGGADRRAE